MKKIKQNTQINKSTVYDDTLPSGVTLESGSESLEDDLNAIRSQLEKIIGSGNWYDVYVAPAGTDELVKVSANDLSGSFLLNKIDAGTGISITETNDGGNETITITNTVTNTDESVKVSVNDTTAGYLLGKIVAGANVTITEVDDGLSETLEISAVGDTNTDENIKISSNDQTSDYLLNKLVSGTGISLTEINNGSVETLEIASTVVNTDQLVKVTSNDSTANYLLNKLAAGTGITLTENNNGGNETITITNTITNTDQLVKVSSNDSTAGYLFSKVHAGRNISLVELNNGGNEDLSIRHDILPGLGTAIGPPDIVSETLLSGLYGTPNFVYNSRGIYRDFASDEPIQNEVIIQETSTPEVNFFLANAGSIVTSKHYGVLALQNSDKGFQGRIYCNANTFLPPSGNNYWKRFEAHIYVPPVALVGFLGIHNSNNGNEPTIGSYVIIDADAGDILARVRVGGTIATSIIGTLPYNTWIRIVIIACESQSFIYVLSEDGQTVLLDLTPASQPSLAGTDPLRPSINLYDQSSSGSTCFYIDWFAFNDFNKPV